MKIYRIMKENKLRQNVFYNWLRDNEMIVKESTGYVVGPKALPGMETITSSEIGPDGQVLKIQTQVTVADESVPQLLEQYKNSGLNDLYYTEKPLSKEEQLHANVQALTEMVAAIKEQLEALSQAIMNR